MNNSNMVARLITTIFADIESNIETCDLEIYTELPVPTNEACEAMLKIQVMGIITTVLRQADIDEERLADQVMEDFITELKIVYEKSKGKIRKSHTRGPRFYGGNSN